jgi:orotate phosphoribosyltransferase
MTADAVLELFRQSGALLEGHFKLSSGLHSNRYLQSALVLQHPEYAAPLGRAIAESVRTLQPNVVLSPALGGIVIGQETGRALGVRAIFAERTDGRLTLRRGFHLSRKDRAVVVEDVLTTGGSTIETLQVALAAGAEVVAAASIIDRGTQSGRFNVPFFSLVKLEVPVYEPESCPMCARGEPMVKPGSRV